MQNMKLLTFCIFLQAIILAISIPKIHCRSTFQSNHEKQSLIENTCKKTPNYNICLQSLKTNSGSSSVILTRMGLTILKVMQTKANNALNKIHQLQVGAGGTQKTALSSCAEKYNGILIAIPQAIEALQKGDPKLAGDVANDVTNEVNSCESDFSENSPITSQNDDMLAAAILTTAIVRLFPKN